MTRKVIRVALIISMLAVGYSSYADSKDKTQNTKPLKANKEWERTRVENIFYTKNKEKGTIDLYIINDKNQIVEFKDLQGVGKIEDKKPLLLVKGNKVGCINTNGEIIRSIENEYISDFSSGEAIIKNGKFGVINLKGEEVIPSKYEEIYIGENKNYIVKKDGAFYLYDLKNFKKLDVDYIHKINDKLFVFSKESKFGIISIENKVIVPNEYDEISMHIDKTFIGMKGESFAVYSLDNKKITEDFDYIEQVGENEYIGGTFAQGKYAFLSEKIKTDEKYENVIKVDKDRFIGEISINSYEVIDLKKDEIENMSRADVNKYIELIKRRKNNE